MESNFHWSHIIIYVCVGFLFWEQWIRPMFWHNEDDEQKDTDLNDENKRPDELEPEE